jgi:hypothetical protein
MRLALDPGQTTGVAYRKPDADLCSHMSHDGLVCYNCDGGALRGLQWPGEDIMAVLEGLHAVYGLTEIAIEDFISRPGAAVNLSAPRVIGRIQAWAEVNDVPYVMQTPSAAKTVITKDRLRALGGWVRGQEHARDALRHLLYREQKLGLLELPPK